MTGGLSLCNPVMTWRPVQAVPHLSPGACWRWALAHCDSEQGQAGKENEEIKPFQHQKPRIKYKINGTSNNYNKKVLYFLFLKKAKVGVSVIKLPHY